MTDDCAQNTEIKNKLMENENAGKRKSHVVERFGCMVFLVEHFGCMVYGRLGHLSIHYILIS